jgi:DNA-binding CsgD family transcriptional regulator
MDTIFAGGNESGLALGHTLTCTLPRDTQETRNKHVVRRVAKAHGATRAVAGAHTLARRAGPLTVAVGGALAHARDAGASHRGDTRIAAELMTARDADERIRLVRAMLNVIGFRSLAYFTVQAESDEPLDTWATDTLAPSHFGDGYFTAGYQAHDPRLAAVRGASAPLVWDLAWLLRAWRQCGSPPAMCSLFDDLQRDEVKSGVMLGIATLQGGLRAVVSLSSTQPERDWISDNVLAQALALGLSLHRFASDPAHVPRAPAPVHANTPSDMQTRILACLAGGLSDKQIASRLQTTPHNVDYHLRFLRRKYGAANRTHLAFLAGGMALELV